MLGRISTVTITAPDLPAAVAAHQRYLGYGFVDDVDALAAELASSPFRIIGGPADLSFSDQIRAMQVVGPAREVLYLTQADQTPPAAASLPYSDRRSQACVGAAGELIELIESG